MNCLTTILALTWAFCCLTAASGFFLPTRGEDNTLVLVHTLFRHGNRVPNRVVYPSNPISNESFYMPYGFGQLTNDGKRTEYKIGTTLRERYDSFLGDTYNYKLVDARTTNVDRTKMSLELVLASLWPPKGLQIWKPQLNWQPIPYNYYTNDKELSPRTTCQNYAGLNTEMENSAEIQQLLSKYQDIYDYVSNHTGESFRNPGDIFELYFESVAQRDFGYPLENWLDPIMPELEKITKDVYYIGANTTMLKKLVGGFLLRKIIEDSEAKINGTLSPAQRKMFIYSAHERNVADFLLVLGVYEDKIPTYGSHVLVELHNIDNVFGFKVFYQDWTTKEPKLLTIPGCAAFCPFDEFVNLLSEVIPTDDDCILELEECVE